MKVELKVESTGRSDTAIAYVTGANIRVLANSLANLRTLSHNCAVVVGRTLHPAMTPAGAKRAVCDASVPFATPL